MADFYKEKIHEISEQVEALVSSVGASGLAVPRQKDRRNSMSGAPAAPACATS